MAETSTYTIFWLYQANATRLGWSEEQRAAAREAFLSTLEAHQRRVSLRGAYSAVGFCPDVDLILWLVADDLDAFQRLAADLSRTPLAAALDLRRVYLGVAAMSRYAPEHGPAFLRGIPPKRYLSVYPFTKTPDWYLLPFEQRRELMVEHGRLGEDFPSILTNTVSSFGIADQEFVVALEDDDPAMLVEMVQKLRSADVRVYTQLDTPIYLGQRKDPEDALRDVV